MFCLFVPLIHLRTTAFHPVHNFHIPAELSAATHSQIDGCQAFPVSCPSHSTDKLPFYHNTRMPSCAYLYRLRRTDRHGRFLVNTDVSTSICWNLSHGRVSSPDEIGLATAKPLNKKSGTFIPFLALICSSVYLLFLFPVSSLDHFLKVEHLLASRLVAFAATYWPLGLDDDSCSTHWNLATAILREWMD